MFTSRNRQLLLNALAVTLVLFAVMHAHGQSLVGDVLRLKPSALPLICTNGDVRIDAADQNKPKVCDTNTWVPFGSSDDVSYEGYSARFNEAWDSDGIDDTFQKIIKIQYTPPTINFTASGSGTIREKGDAVTASTLTASVTKRSDPIAEVRFYIGATLLATQTSGGAIPNGGNSLYSWTGSFSDNTTFSAQVDDNGATGGPTTVSGSANFVFVYPYYVGAGAPGLSAASVAGLTKRVITSTTSRTETISATNGQVFYFAYPSSYGALTSILDVNNFETLPDWTLRTESITGLDGSSQTYRIYEFENPVLTGSYQYTFRR